MLNRNEIYMTSNVTNFALLMHRKELIKENSFFRKCFTLFNPFSKSKKIAALDSLIAHMQNPELPTTKLQQHASILLEGRTGQIIEKAYPNVYAQLVDLSKQYELQQAAQHDRIATSTMFKLKFNQATNKNNHTVDKFRKPAFDAVANAKRRDRVETSVMFKLKY